MTKPFSVPLSASRQLQDLLNEAGVEVKIGLKAQGHLLTVAIMRQMGYSWEDIGQQIGWNPSTVEEWYELEKDPPNPQLDEALALAGFKE